MLKNIMDTYLVTKIQGRPGPLVSKVSILVRFRSSVPSCLWYIVRVLSDVLNARFCGFYQA